MRAAILVAFLFWAGLFSGTPQNLTTLSRNSLYNATNHNPSGFTVQASPWAYSSAGNSNSIDASFTQTVTVDQNRFPANTTMAWSWPNTQPAWSVYGFPSVILGDSGGYTFTEAPNAPPPTQVANFVALSSTFNYGVYDPDAPVGGVTSNFDICFDMFLTSVPHVFIPNDGTSNILFEVLVYVRPNYTPSGTHLLDYVSAGQTWNVRLLNSATPPIITVTPAAGVYSGTFDFKPMFVDLISLGTLTGNEWLAGISFGSEPACCSGKLYLTNLSYNWQ